MPIKEKVFWHDTVSMPGEEILVDLPARVDFAVIGGGIPGLAAALRLARRGASVAVLEAESMGWGASSRNGGMVLTGLKLGMETIDARYGRDLTQALFEDSVRAIDTVEQLVTSEHIACDFQRSGHLLLANKPAHYQALEKEAEMLASRFNHSTRLVTRQDLQSEIGSQVYHGALLDEASAGLNPAQYVVGLAQAAQRSGVALCAFAQVTRLVKVQSGFHLATTRGDLQASQVLVTTGGYTSNVTPALQRRVIPIGSFIIATRPLEQNLAAELIPQRRMLFDYRHFLNYFRLSADNRMVFGGRAAFFPETPNTIKRSAIILRQQMVQVFPQLREVEVDYVWGGTLDFPFDLMPHAGQMEGVFFALGFAGHGVALGTQLGTRLADCMLSGTLKDLPYASYPFPTAPLGVYHGKPWFLPLIGAWHKILDWVE